MALVVGMVIRYGVDVPYWDEWEMVEAVDRSYGGTLTCEFLEMQHNEHRPMATRVIILGLIRGSRWRVPWELATNFVLATATFALLSTCLARAADGGTRWLLPPFSILHYSVVQWENWLWGWQAGLFLCHLSASGALVLLVLGRLDSTRFLIAAVLGVVATASFGHGLLVWPLGALLLLGRCAARVPFAWGAAGAWFALGTAVLLRYSVGYVHPVHHPALGFSVGQLGGYFAWVCTLLGAPLNVRHALPVGAAGLLIFVCGQGWLAWREGGTLGQALAFLVPGWFGVAGGFLVGVGRAGLGIEQAFQARYTTFTLTMWAGVLVILWMLARAWRGSRWRRIGRLGCGLGIGAIVWLAAVRGVGTIPEQRLWSERMARGREALRDDGPDEALLALYPDVGILRQRREILRRLELSVFRDASSGR